MMSLTVGLVVLSLGMVSLSNPLNLSLALIAMSALMFLLTFLSSGWSTLSSIFMLIFLGGIMMMFMLVSSVSPNAQMGKFGSLLWVTLVVVLVCMPQPSSILAYSSEAKMFLESGFNIPVMTALIVLYFATFIYLLVDPKISLRSFCS